MADPTLTRSQIQNMGVPGGRQPIAKTPVPTYKPGQLKVTPQQTIGMAGQGVQGMTSSIGPIQAPAQKTTTTQAYDYSADPVLQSVQAAGARSRSDAESAALAAKKRLAIAFGDATGIVDDTGTAEAARGNSFSTLAELNRAYGRDVDNIDESFNKRNLFYSGHRAQGLARALEGKQRNEYGARGSLVDALLGIDREKLSALNEIQNRELQAQNDAADRALQSALEYGIDPGQGQQAQVQQQAPLVQALTGQPYRPPENPAEIKRQLAAGVNPIMFFK